MTAPPPGRDRYQPLFQLADGHRRLGYQAAAASDQVTVHREYQAALGLLRQLAEVVPVEQDLLRDLAAGHHREGNHAAVMGYGLAARYEYQADLVMLQRLAQARRPRMRGCCVTWLACTAAWPAGLSRTATMRRPGASLRPR
jgi:hypothetical protein